MTAVRPVPTLAWPADVGLCLPASKSDANRKLVLAAVARTPASFFGLTLSEDVERLLAGLRQLGFCIEPGADALHLSPPAARGASRRGPTTLDCGNAGTALRFLVSLCAITPGDWVITGDPAMQRRPIGPLVDAWRALGIDAEATNGCPPVRIRGCTPRGGEVELDAGASSQFVSSLLLVGSALPNGLRVRFRGPLASAQYAAWTVATLRAAGCDAALDDRGASVQSRSAATTAPTEYHIAGDWSSMGAWTCLAFLTGSRLTAANLPYGSEQADERLGAVLATLAGRGDRTIDVAPVPDQFLNLAVVAALRPGTTRFVGGANLRHKECDRLAVLARELRRCGGRVDETVDGVVVHGGRPLHGATIDPQQDHRVAMAFALLGLLVPGIAIAEPDCVAKSYPAFWRDLDRVLASRRPVVVVGGRAAGKSTFAAAFAARTGARLVDSDAAFVAAHGPIAPFVAAHGWPRFRELERELVAAAVAPGQVIATGGGAIEAAATREQLRQRALVVWIDGPAALLQERLRADPATRPSLTGADPVAELPAVLNRRNPLYAEVATVRLAAEQPTGRQVEQALHLLGAPCRFAYTHLPSDQP